jgi:hypothetical protein
MPCGEVEAALVLSHSSTAIKVYEEVEVKFHFSFLGTRWK